MSGWYPHVRGHRTMHYMLHEDEPVLLKTLKEAGYFVWWGGKNDLLPGQHSPMAYCNVKHKPHKALDPDLHSMAEWRGPKEGDNYYSFYAGKLPDHRQEVYYDSGLGQCSGRNRANPPSPAGTSRSAFICRWGTRIRLMGWKNPGTA